ncbi:MAG: DUF58 domain-containing protein [Bacteroidetes bacterium]|jgi:uncharacterized protein (DUF58 family)|nr:DUF58 domain-containing protein [Bacteroidota bacterium]MBT3424429.1 DUF58 domain-containing protein [Bacteroidota bacterium]MBT3801439.1 DUF58 domain-containing protein [Bacteroidota bacterium]MBT4729001.1 DUF58 domain-containing protein [Bacteroidota bacterium]MBT5992370.1 DUF58 domain-containing protein [Bacteroidota bacterium]
MAKWPNGHIDLEMIQQLGNLDLIARYVVEGFITGLHKSPFHGFSVEFAEHRLYNSGESTKHIDWKLFGRTDKLFVKKYEEETNLRCMLLIDNSSSMYFPDSKHNKLKFSVYAAASLIQLLRKQRDAVGLTLFSDEIEEFYPPKASFAHVQLLFNQLQKNLNNDSKNKKTSTASTLHQIAENIHKRSLVVIFSDMMENIDNQEEYLSGLQHLKYKKHEVILFHVVDKSKELDFTYENRPYRFIDMESGDKVEVFPDDIRNEYLKKMAGFRDELKLRCSQYHIDYVEADIHTGFFTVLQNYLVKRQKLY